MAIRMQHYLSYDRQKGRWQYVRMFPPAVRPLTGRFYKHSYPKSVSYDMAKDLACDQTAEYLARCEAAYEALGTSDGIITALQAMRARRQAGLRAVADSLNRFDEIKERIADRAQLRALAERIGIPVPAMPIVHEVIGLDRALTDWKKRHGPWPDEASEKKAVKAKTTAAESLFTSAGTSDMAAITTRMIQTWKDDLDGRQAHDFVAHVKGLYTALAANNRPSGGNPAGKIETPRKPEHQERRPFSDDDAKRIIASAIASGDPDLIWGHVLPAFQGTIASEIVYARPEDFYWIGETLVFDMTKRKLKTPFRQREIPVHPAAIRLRFVDFLEARKGKRLFNLNATQFSAKLMAHIRSLGIEGDDQVHYCWRHGFISQLDSNGVSGALQRYLSGHAAPDVHEKHYFHRNLEKMIEAIGGLFDPTSSASIR